ncbi:MAG: Crp/Fnr family transcriptional regulator [Candidatus Eremiobacteraeota bacterium]|nr:Crp/Fnr family transcriptional regulator [Candidatus Eremiobacteraeota bacterium]
MYHGGNRLLDALPPAEIEAITPKLTIVTVRSHELVEEPGSAYQQVDFPIDAVYSIIAVLTDGNACEVGTVGREGFIAAEASLGQTKSRRTTVCQVPGRAARMGREQFRHAMSRSSELARLTQRNVSARLFASEQFTACNLMHSVASRCARWLMMTCDRVGRDDFSLTQDFLATMLGVRRAGVTQAAMSLKDAGAIEYHRGHVIVRDHAKLIAAACECYVMTRDAFEDALAPA